MFKANSIRQPWQTQILHKAYTEPTIDRPALSEFCSVLFHVSCPVLALSSSLMRHARFITIVIVLGHYSQLHPKLGTLLCYAS